MRGDEQLDRSTDSVAGPSESLTIGLLEGRHEVWVAAWTAAADEFTLNRTWARPLVSGA